MSDPIVLTKILQSLKIKAECVNYRKVRNVSLYDLKLFGTGKVKDIERYANEIALALKAYSKPLVKAIPSDGIVRLEIVAGLPEKVSLFDGIIRGTKENYILPTYLGSDMDGKDIWCDLSQNPHSLVAGTTGSGKSVFLHSMFANSLRIMNTVIFAIDTKRVEFELYKRFDNISIANDYSEAMKMLNRLYREMEYRFVLLANGIKKDIPNIVVIIDELADLSLQQNGKEFSDLLCRIIQKCRAAKMYFVIATQRPSVDLLPGSIKANLPARIAFQTATSIDSRVALDTNGAECLSGRGDAIIRNYQFDNLRLQMGYTTAEEVCDRYSNFAFGNKR